MEGFWSLTIFTLLGQAAAGMAILKALFEPADTHVRPKWLYFALVLLGTGTVASLLHLSAPQNAFFSITNPGTSWLSREILGVGLFGAGLVLLFFRRTPFFVRLSGLTALCMVYAMSRVYTMPNLPFWDSSLTLASFLATAILLGGSLLFLLDVAQSWRNREAFRAALCGWKNCIVGLALVVRLALAPLQALQSATPDATLLTVQIVLLGLGAVLGLRLLRQALNSAYEGRQQQVLPVTGTSGTAKDPASCGCPTEAPETSSCDCSPQPAKPSSCGCSSGSCCACTPIGSATLALLAITAGELCGRILFYTSYTNFGM